MATTDIAGDISPKVERVLASTPYECSSLLQLRGGTTNYLFHAKLITPLASGIQDVLVKHGEPFIASHPNFKLSISRCLLEKNCLARLSALPPYVETIFSVRTPRLLHFVTDTKTQVQEYLVESLDLKSYALKHFVEGPEGLEPLCHSLGHALGAWLRNFHHWAAAPTQRELHELAASNQSMQGLKGEINYSRLVRMAQQKPALLGDAEEVFRQVQAAAAAELRDSENLQVIHGDFWSGNIILPDRKLVGSDPVTAFVVDWEMCQLGVRAIDVGQMIAELYEITLFKGTKAGTWLVEGFAGGYGMTDDQFAARVAIHVGTHLVCWSNAPSWGDEAQVEGVIGVGKELILRAWHKEVGWFRSHDLRCLFDSTQTLAHRPGGKSKYQWR